MSADRLIQQPPALSLEVWAAYLDRLTSPAKPSVLPDAVVSNLELDKARAAFYSRLTPPEFREHVRVRVMQGAAVGDLSQYHPLFGGSSTDGIYL